MLAQEHEAPTSRDLDTINFLYNTFERATKFTESRTRIADGSPLQKEFAWKHLDVLIP